MGAKILLVDDTDLVLRVLGLQLEAEGFTVATSSSSQHGFDVLAEATWEGRQFNLLITDLDMPGSRGTVLIKAVRELEAYDGVAPNDRLPVLLLTGADLSTISEFEQDELMALGVSYLSKQDAANKLIPTVRGMLHAGSAGLGMFPIGEGG